ncbi:hypothetical protein EBS43_01735 [bacterium]|jgi:hypothetical protein|nr:hypothetical protein [bacterium]
MKYLIKKFSSLFLVLLLAQSSFASLMDHVRFFQTHVDYKALGVTQVDIGWEGVAHASLKSVGKGGEGFTFVTSRTANDCYKRFRRVGESEFGAASLLYVRQEVAKHPELMRWIEVPRLYGFGVGWLHKEYFPTGIKLKVALTTSERARVAYEEIIGFLEKSKASCAEGLNLEFASMPRTAQTDSDSRVAEEVGSESRSIAPLRGVSPVGLLFHIEGALSEGQGGESLVYPQSPQFSQSHGQVGSNSAAAAFGLDESVESPTEKESTLSQASAASSDQNPACAGVLHATGLRADFDFFSGLLQRFEFVTNNFLWVPEIERFVWIDIF